MTNVRVHLIISGKVQGVGFRYFVRKKATQLGVKGWVKNLKDGRVEAIFEGPKVIVDSLVELTKQGPQWSKVNNVEIQETEYCNEFEDFKIDP